MPFSWLPCTPPREGGRDCRMKGATAELAGRAPVLHRVGFAKAEAARRLSAGGAWEYASAAKQPRVPRPDALSDAAIAKIVCDAFDRRPGRVRPLSWMM
jgi:hypothetical protein